MNYSQLTNLAGGKALERVLQYSILLYMYATCLACTIVITQLFVFLLNDFGVSEDITGSAYQGITWVKSAQAVATSVFILFPLSLGKSMAAFRNLSLVGLICLIVTILVSLPQNLILL